jgi:aspartate racemase
MSRGSSALHVPLLHTGDGTADAGRAARLRRVGLLGTAFTREQSFLVDRLGAHRLDVLVPGPSTATSSAGCWRPVPKG